ncbi:MAG: hypothetical protein IKE02_03790 [Lachnospiraceae bacterium]|nr:hypothetical protein [Lachnospiraceae bacterium]
MIVSKKDKNGTVIRLEGSTELVCAEATMILISLQDTADQTENKSMVDMILATFLMIRDKAYEKGVSLAELMHDTSADELFNDCFGRMRS